MSVLWLVARLVYRHLTRDLSANKNRTSIARTPQGWPLLLGTSQSRSPYSGHMCLKTNVHPGGLQGGALHGISAEGLGYVLPLQRKIGWALAHGLGLCVSARFRRTFGVLMRNEHSKLFSDIGNSKGASSVLSYPRGEKPLRLELVSGYRTESAFVASLLQEDRLLLVRQG